MHRQITSPVYQCLIQFFYKQSFAAHFIQCPIQDLITGCLHRQQTDLFLGTFFFQVIHHHLTLDHRQTALPASDTDRMIYHCLDLFSKFGSSFMVFSRTIDADHIRVFADHSREMKITFFLVTCHIDKRAQTFCHTVDPVI